MAHKQHHHRRIAHSVVFTTLLLGLISLAIGGTEPAIALWTIASVVGLALVFHLYLSGSAFFSVVFANSIGVYACLFVFLVSANFHKVTVVPMEIGFLLPLVSFLAGVLFRRRDISRLVQDEREASAGFSRVFVWLLPLAATCAVTFALPIQNLETKDQNQVLLISMGIIALTTFLASRDIAVFLLDTGILFEDFFANAARLAKPAFAFLTCYSLVVIVFASVFTILDRYTADTNFAHNGAGTPLTFADGLYLSVSTLSTVGYGDITATSPLARLLISLETLGGILLLLFGVEALLASGRRGK